MFRQMISPVTAKKLLVKYLTGIRDIRNSIMFCELLVEAKKLKSIRSPRVPIVKGCQSSNMTAPKLIHRLKKLTAKGQPKYVIAEKLAYVLHAPEDQREKAKDLSQLLLKINNLDYLDIQHNNSKEYLRRLIIATDYLINSYTKQSLFHANFCNYATDSIQALVIALHLAANYNISSLLDIIFKIGRDRLNFTEKEQKQIGMLMVGAIKPIELCIDNTRFHDWKSDIFTLQKRSALQFLIDDYSTFPSKRGATLKSFYEDKINKSAVFLDNKMSIVCKFMEGCKDGVQDIGIYNPMDETYLKKFKSEMPESHTWWAQYLQGFKLTKCKNTLYFCLNDDI